ncbi:hypothetical protein MLD38_026447 [Melastoma candidum]|uniref:Uncharacterized protein n=1 Tax=Melastoma candidum TaxID=119954 RepID=A0ACB9P002_9MYRT|nr:hypothetical protein MLD38_026447 [Melastoma candidum]
MESHIGWAAEFVSRKVSEPDRTYVQARSTGQTVLCILLLSVAAAVIFLASYYLIIRKCCPNCHPGSLLSHFSASRWGCDANHDIEGSDDSFIAFSPSLRSRGLDSSLICQMPTFQFSSSGQVTYHQCSHGCMVCLNEFREQDVLKLLPGCGHAFHFDCIDAWLQTNCNCPVCRMSVAGTSAPHLEASLAAPSSSPQDSEIHSGSLTGRGDDDFIVIELWSGDRVISFERQASGCSRREQSISDRYEKTEIEPLDLEQKPCHYDLSMAVEEREQDRSPIQIQQLRRSFSLDSVSDRNLYLQVQAALLQCSEGRKLCRSQEHGRNLRSIIMLPHVHGSKTTVLPVKSKI